MTKRKKNIVRKKHSKLFQFVGILLIIGLSLYLIFSNSLKPDNNEKSKVKAYTSIDFVKNGELTFLSSTEEYISKIDIEIAEDDNSRRDGLMYRDKMGKDQGMLFIFPLESAQSFWMRYTLISLDILFVNSNNEIVTIHKDAIPFDESQYRSTKPAQFVIEVNAGYTDSLRIKEGDKIIWRRN